MRDMTANYGKLPPEQIPRCCASCETWSRYNQRCNAGREGEFEPDPFNVCDKYERDEKWPLPVRVIY